MFAQKVCGLVFSSFFFVNSFAAAAPAQGGSRLNSIEYRIPIKGTAEQVWDAIANFADYGKWNQWTFRIDGDPALGAKLKAYASSGGHLDLKITSFVEDKEICWVDVTWFTRLGAGGWRCRRIEKLPDDEGVVFINHFQYTGVFGGALERVTRDFLEKGMQQENQNLKDYIETD